MKKSYLIGFLTVLFVMGCCTGVAQPILSDINGNSVLRVGEEWTMSFQTTEGGALALQLRTLSGEVAADIGAQEVLAGTGTISWNGYLADGRPVSDGEYILAAALKNFWQETSEVQTLPLSVRSGQQEVEILDLSALDIQNAQMMTDVTFDTAVFQEPEILQEEPAAVAAETEYSLDENGVPYATSFWDMNPDAYDLKNPEHQRAIWDLMMQPITVFTVGQTEHVYPTHVPGADKKPYKTNCAGELHGQSQGINILEDDSDGDGYVKIEAYSNDGTKTKDQYMMSIDNKRISGYVQKKLIQTVEPSRKYALLVDKLRQRLYIFKEGEIIGELEVSTGLNNDKQPYNETPAGEFITVSKVGEFVSGTMRAQFAIRINGGTLLHEVPYRYGRDGTSKVYSEFEPMLGQKASHGCIRIQRKRNDKGQNMAWLWENLENRTRVFIWDDQGRQMYEPELPDLNTPLYRNPNGGSNYHLDQNCSGVRSKFLPLTGDFTYGDLSKNEFKKLTPCQHCGAPVRPEEYFKRYEAEAKQIGFVIDETVRHKFGME